jgi:hypothetical protein
VFIDMIFMWEMEVAVMQVIDVITVAHGGMAAVRPMPVRMVGVSRGRASRHRITFLRYR